MGYAARLNPGHAHAHAPTSIADRLDGASRAIEGCLGAPQGLLHGRR
jgi:hypothetical protein